MNLKFAAYLLFLTAGAVCLPCVARAQEISENVVSNETMTFAEDTIVQFEFLQSNGAYQSEFGVVNLETGERTPLFVEVRPSDRDQSVVDPSDFAEDLTPSDADDFIGTVGTTVLERYAEFEFAANTPYAFYLDSTFRDRSAGTFFSEDAQNPNGEQHVQFEGGFEQLADGTGIFIRWDDTGALLVPQSNEDRDFDDFLVLMGGYLDCAYDRIPESELGGGTVEPTASPSGDGSEPDGSEPAE